MNANIVRIIMRRDTTENWELVNPILNRGEFGVEIQENGSRRIKIGDGISTWLKLSCSYISAEEFTSHLTDANAHDIENIIGAINGNITGLKGDILNLSDSIIQASVRIIASEGAILQITGNISALTSAVDQDRQNNENNINAINNNINNFGNRTTALEVWRNISDAAFTDLSNTVNQNNNNLTISIDGLSTRINFLEIANEIQSADIESIKADIEDIRQNTDLTSLQQTIQRVLNLENATGEVSYRNSVLEIKVSNNINSIGSINVSIVNITNRLDNLEAFEKNIQQQFDYFTNITIQRFDGIDINLSGIHSSITNIMWKIADLYVIENKNMESIGTLRTDFENHVTQNNADLRSVKDAIAHETATRQTQAEELNTAIQNEAIARNQQITDAITAEAQARESQVYELSNALTSGFAYVNGQIQATNQVLDGVRTTSLHGAFLTRVLGGTTEVPISLFGSFTNFQAGKTLIFDESGTVGVFIDNINSATITILTKSISHISGDQPTMLGSVETHADLPIHQTYAEELFGRTVRVDDYVHVKVDETNGNHRVLWYITDISEKGYLEWGNPFVLARDDFQSMTGAVDSGRVLTGGATPGTFGESISIDAAATEGSSNLITSDAVYQAVQEIRAENSFSPDESYTGQSWIDGRRIYRRVLTGNTGITSPTLFGVIPNLGSFVNITGHIRNPNFIDNINTVDINFETGELRGHWPQEGVINDPVWNWWNVGSPTANFAATGSSNTINGFVVTRLGGPTGGRAWGPSGFDMNNIRFTIGAVSPSGTSETTASMRIPGVLDFIMPVVLEIDFGAASGAGAFQVSINNNTVGMANSVHGNASRVVNQTMTGSGTFSSLIDTREWVSGREFLTSSTMTLRGEGTLTMQIFGIRLFRRTSWENSEFNLIFEYTREN